MRRNKKKLLLLNQIDAAAFCAYQATAAGEQLIQQAVAVGFGRKSAADLVEHFHRGGVGARLFEYTPVDWIAIGAELDVFVQPQTVFTVRNLYERPLIVGVNYAVSAELLLYGPLGVLGRLAYKTRGHVMGQPLDEGVHGYFGVFVRP